MCTRKPKNYRDIIVGYSQPTAHDTAKSFYVDFYCVDPATGEMKRKKFFPKYDKSKRVRRQRAAELVAVLTSKLRSGWNPWAAAGTSRSYITMEEALEKYQDYVHRTSRRKTKLAYDSRVNILRQWNADRAISAMYVYQMDSLFWRDFLDYILLDREVLPRTWNNYMGWCNAFCEFLVARKYLDANPMAGVRKMPVTPKRRQPLTDTQMRQMRAYLERTDRHFLLACLMEYFTFVRPTELSFVRIGDISLREQSLFIPAEVSKNKRDGKVGLSKELLALMLDLHVLDMPSDWYLFGHHFKPSPERLGPDQFNKAWKKMRRRLKWPAELQFYSLKDTGIRDLANAKGIVVARDQARHSDISTTNKYLQGRNSLVVEATKDFAGVFAPDPDQTTR